jgi:hypothetical protein
VISVAAWVCTAVGAYTNNDTLKNVGTVLTVVAIVSTGVGAVLAGVAAVKATTVVASEKAGMDLMACATVGSWDSLAGAVSILK